jgi:hypothetical protein
VARLDGQDRPGDGQVVFVRDLAGGAEVRADADAFEDAGDAEELCDGGHGEGVEAFFGRGGAESGGEEVDVSFLVAGDLGQASVGACGDSGGGEVGGGKFGEAFAVEGCFEVFEGESILEDVDWGERVSRFGVEVERCSETYCQRKKPVTASC